MQACAPVETELKLAVAALPALRRRLARFGAGRVQELDSVYFDTPDRLLFSNAMALRLRRVGRRWVQTLKRQSEAQGALAVRNEWEHAVSARALALNALADTPLAHLLAQHPQARLAPAFRTRFFRTVWQVERAEGAVEVALDVGRIEAGRRHAPISELELELKRGAPALLFDLALEIAGGTLALLPLGDSKALRGYRLAAQAKPAPAAANARGFVALLAPDTAVDAALRAVIAHGTNVLVANAHGALASDDAEFIHQARVALRRMRSALRIFKRVPFPAALADEMRWAAQVLGQSRDWDVFAETTLPRFVAAVAAQAGAAGNAPPDRRADAWAAPLHAGAAAWRAGARVKVRAALGSARFAQLTVRLLQWAARPDRDDAPNASLRKLAASKLQRAHDRLFEAARFFVALSPERQHRVRILAKRLRYALDLFAVALPKKTTAAFHDRLAELQDVLGEMNDIAVAKTQWPRLTRSADLRQRAAQYFDERSRVLALEAERRLYELAQTPLPWRKA